MEDRPKLERNVHDLLDEANVMLLLPTIDRDKAADLIERMRDSADQARAAGATYYEAERRLRNAADALEKKI